MSTFYCAARLFSPTREEKWALTIFFRTFASFWNNCWNEIVVELQNSKCRHFASRDTKQRNKSLVLFAFLTADCIICLQCYLLGEEDRGVLCTQRNCHLFSTYENILNVVLIFIRVTMSSKELFSPSPGDRVLTWRERPSEVSHGDAGGPKRHVLSPLAVIVVQGDNSTARGRQRRPGPCTLRFCFVGKCKKNILFFTAVSALLQNAHEEYIYFLLLRALTKCLGKRLTEFSWGFPTSM